MPPDSLGYRTLSPIRDTDAYFSNWDTSLKKMVENTDIVFYKNEKLYDGNVNLSLD